MPVYIHLANLIIDKTAIAAKYVGGIEQFRTDYINANEEYNQEDDELFSIARMNADEFDIDALISKGLHFNNELQTSTDFVIRPRYGSSLWRVDWLADNDIFAWHLKADKDLIAKANAIAETTMDELGALADSGMNPVATLRNSPT